MRDVPAQPLPRGVGEGRTLGAHECRLSSARGAWRWALPSRQAPHDRPDVLEVRDAGPAGWVRGAHLENRSKSAKKAARTRARS